MRRLPVLGKRETMVKMRLLSIYIDEPGVRVHIAISKVYFR